ncbi:MAG TPA: hypothetical protein VEB20_20240 [Azospirillaceae bacterium]|nr:hypothetical protein [Azospirillaceae bacterium]
MTDMTFSTATETQGFLSRLWAATPDTETVFMLATAACLALGIMQIF